MSIAELLEEIERLDESDDCIHITPLDHKIFEKYEFKS